MLSRAATSVCASCHERRPAAARSNNSSKPRSVRPNAASGVWAVGAGERCSSMSNLVGFEQWESVNDGQMVEALAKRVKREWAPLSVYLRNLAKLSGQGLRGV